MKSLDYLLCVICVGLVSVGQVLLRQVAQVLQNATEIDLQTILSTRILMAFTIYGGAMLMWLWILGRVPITQAFAFFGLSFFLVPYLANRYLGDPINQYTWIGAIIILTGILVTNIKG